LSRESSIRLDRRGRFWHEGELVEHRGLARAFARWIRRHPDDGRYVLDNGYDWCYLAVEDTPYFVQALRVGSDSIQLELSDGSTETLILGELRIGRDEVLRTRVKGGAFEAKFSRVAQLQVEPLLDPEPPLALRWAGRRHVIRDDTSS
jgi:hypothetical protein